MNSSPCPRTFAEFLASSLEHLRREVPTAYRAMCDQAKGALRVIVDGEDLGLAFGEGKHVFIAPPQAPAVRLETGRGTLLDLIDGKLTLVEAVAADRLRLYGSTADIAAFYEAIVFYLRGAVRAFSFPDLLARYRAAEPMQPDGAFLRAVSQ